MTSITIKFIAITIAVIELERKHNQLVRPQILQRSYNYIVVGAGASGAVVAARLAEDYRKNILLLEAGGPQNATSDVPAFQYEILSQSNSEWNYPMVRQKYAYIGRRSGMKVMLRAKSFGGCTVHNGLNYYRDSKEYWDLWDSVYGIKNWTFADVLPYFLKSENNLDERLVRTDPKYHRSGGLLPVSTADPDIMLRRYVDIAMSLGSKWTHMDGRDPMGITIMQRTIKDGIRQSTATAFLESDIKPNLHTIGFAFVTKILFNENKRAIGVKFRRHDVWHTVYARNEVILSAGVVGSPQLLMLSGIGPKEHLNSMRIPVISDVSVGSHMSYDIVFNNNYDIINQTEIEKPDKSLDNFFRLFVNGHGPLAYKAAAMQCFAEMTESKNVCKGFTYPRTAFLPDDFNGWIDDDFKRRKEWEDYYRPYLGHAIFMLYAGINRAKSIGTLRLKSANPFEYPIIDPCVFCDPRDLEDVIKVFQMVSKFYENFEIRKYIRRFKKPIPGCTPCAGDFFCYEYIECMAQTMTNDLYIVGTCRMGSDTDPDGVVDNEFRVRGVNGLRVIDTSVMPLDVSEETALAIMIGERGAEFVKQVSNL